MALIERLMGEEEPKIPVHSFFAAIQQRIDGKLTRQEVLDMFAMDTAAEAEYDLVAALAPTGSTALATAERAIFIDGIHSTFILAEGGYPGYSTPTEVRTKIGI